MLARVPLAAAIQCIAIHLESTSHDVAVCSRHFLAGQQSYPALRCSSWPARCSTSHAVGDVCSKIAYLPGNVLHRPCCWDPPHAQASEAQGAGEIPLPASTCSHAHHGCSTRYQSLTASHCRTQLAQLDCSPVAQPCTLPTVACCWRYQSAQQRCRAGSSAGSLESLA